MDTNDPLILVYTRNAFYRRLYYLAFAAYALSMFVIIVLALVLLYLIKNPTRPLFFATDNVGRLIHVVPINIPNMTFDEVVAWSTSAVESAFSMDYINYRSQLQDAEKYFTNYGWNNFMSTLTASNNLVALRNRQMVVMAKVVGQPTVDRQGLMGSGYAWKFTMPVLVTYSLPPYDDQHQFSNALSVSVIIQRQQALQGYKGLGVVQMIGTLAATPSSGPQQLTIPQAPSS
jgi:intracellular multiplication protein IcmL